MKAPPNLLFLFTDEQRCDTMRAYGNQRIETPNLDRLAASSCVFDRAYVTQPVCTPSRSTLLTGLYPHTNGCTENNRLLPEDTPCLPEMLPEGVYATGYHGKWHLGDEIFPQHGFDDWRSVEDMYAAHYRPGRDRSQRSTYHQWLIARGLRPRNGEVFGRGEAARLPEKYSKPAYLALEATRFLRENRGRPWMLFVNFLEPHMPFFGPRDDQYDPAEVTLPPNFENVPDESWPLKARLFAKHYYESGHSGLPLKTEADWRRLIANYWGLCSLVDTHVGAILDELERTGQADDTIVVYTSDHGDMMGSHRLLAKCVMYEEAVRVPLLLRLPGQVAPRRVAGPVSQVDLPPTLLDLMGADRPEHLQGRSLRPLLTGGPRPPADDAFIEWNGPNCGLAADVVGKVELPEHLKQYTTVDEARSAICDPLRTVLTTDGWKFTLSPLRGEHELFDLNEDPFETRSLARRPEQAERIRELTDRIYAWRGRTGDLGGDAEN